MIVYKRKLNVVWYKAAALGSIWASFEIVLGSFLHNIKFPLSGTILAMLSVILLITFAQIWKDKGLFVRAGLIAALMKSISPSAILIGPMTGIFFEALIIEICLSVFGRNFFAYLLSGIFALYSVIIHKIITLLILYGTDIVRISKNLYFFIIKQLNVNDLNFWEALLLLSTFYVILGIFASLIGYFTGREARKSSNTVNDSLDVKSFQKDFLSLTKKRKLSSVYLLIHLISIVLIFVLLNITDLNVSLSVAFVYILFCRFRYKNSYKQFKIIGFWIQIFVVLIISVLFYNGVQNISILDKEGLTVGLMMIARMLVILFGFASISVELRNPVVKAILFRNGFGSLYNSMALAFSVLPSLIEKTGNPKLMLKNPKKTSLSIINYADVIYNQFVEKIKQRKVIIIAGERNSGKTTTLLKVSERLKELGYKIGGFMALGKTDKENKKHFFISDLHSQKKMLMCTTKEISKLRICNYFFNPAAIEFGKKITSAEYLKEDKYAVIDEIGPLELKSEGWSDVVERIFEEGKPIQVWAVRKNLIRAVVRRFAINQAVIFDIKEDKIEEIVDFLVSK